MGSRSLQWLRLLLIAALLVAALPSVVLAQDNSAPENVQGEVIAEGFNGPMGVLVDSAGDIWVVDSGTGGDEVIEGIGFTGEPITATMGMSARVIRISATDSAQTEMATLPSFNLGTEAEGGSRVALLRGIPYVTAPGWHPGMVPMVADEALPLTGGILRITPAGEAVESVPMWEYERDNDTDNELDTHPYGLIATDDGALLMTDAGGNTLYRVNPASRRARLLATFDPLPGVFPNPKYNNEMLTDAVPTGVTVREGVIYVAFLSGAPFLPGNAKVVTVAEDGAVADYASGLTMLTDLRTGPDGELYAVQFGLANEQGYVPDTGALLRIQEGDASEVLVSGLSFPTSIAFNADGDAYVTVNGVGAPGSGQLLRFADLTGATGTPVAEAAAGAAPAGSEAEGAEVGAAEPVTDTAAVAGATADAGAAADTGDSVLASDQESDGSSVIVDSVTTLVDGWVVIHADEGGSPGAVLGHTSVPAGTTENVVVILDPALAADASLWAMLHIDAGEVGTYEFPGSDTPVMVGGEIVMAPFAVTVAAADTGAAAEATAEATEEATAEATEEAAAAATAEPAAEATTEATEEEAAAATAENTAPQD
jgi:sugar lactone lactonase YvrE